MKLSNRLSCFTVLLLLLFAGSTFALDNFIKGYVVLNSGDTLHGLIEDEEWKVNPSLIYFKDSATAEPTIFSPLQISMFRLEKGNWYVSYSGLVDATSLEVSKLTYHPKPYYIRDTFFLRVLEAGAAFLYYGRDIRERDHFFISKPGDTLAELQYNRYLVGDADGTHTRANEGYRLQLMNLISDCASLAEKFMTLPLEYNKASFVSLVQSYNQCEGRHAEYSEPKENWTFEFFAIAGINTSKLRFHDNTGYYLTSAKMERSFGYMAGVELNAITPRNNKRWSINNKLFLKNYKAYGNIAADNEPENSIYIDFLYLKLATTMQYASLNTRVKPFFGLGMTNAVALKDVNTRTYSNGNVLHLFNDARNYEFGLLLEGGLSMKKFLVTGMFELSNGMTPLANVLTRVTTLYLAAGYKF
ncbi:MAG: hypothetical protein K1X61_10190 [Chitinophagales bacterium]|nr:hypothetical protein [Chitinophagales bacterium]